MAQIAGIDHKYIVVPTIAVSVGIAAYSLHKLHSIQSKDKNASNGEDEAITAGSKLYESHKLLSEYLVFHYGKPEELIPYPFGPKDSLDFPKRCAELCLKHFKNKGDVPLRALDIGCAVGRSSFELSRGVSEVIGIDYSQSFIDAANTLKKDGSMEYSIVQEGDIFKPTVAEIDRSIDRSKVSFEQGDACNLRPSLGEFGIVLAANLICRLHHPKKFLNSLSSLLPHRGSILVITAPYTWQPDYSDKSEWLGGFTDAEGKDVVGFDSLKKELGSKFDLLEAVDMPFFIRETARKNQWTVAHATVWSRK